MLETKFKVAINNLEYYLEVLTDDKDIKKRTNKDIENLKNLSNLFTELLKYYERGKKSILKYTETVEIKEKIELLIQECKKND